MADHPRATPNHGRSGNRNGRRPSPFGETVGGGIEISAGRVRIGPVVRYTRGRSDANLWKTTPDQAEFLVRFSWR